MIGRLSGILLEKDFSSCLLDVNGVGYEVLIPLSTFDKLPLENERVALFIHTQVREDAITLFGFSSAEERSIFKKVIEVSGIGGKLALNILSSMPVSAFCAALEAGDVKALSRINGIGKRIAERLVVELKGRIDALPGTPAAVVSGGEAADACAALEQLGFKRDAVTKVINALISELPESECNAENLLRKALGRLNSGK